MSTRLYPCTWKFTEHAQEFFWDLHLSLFQLSCAFFLTYFQVDFVSFSFLCLCALWLSYRFSPITIRYSTSVHIIIFSSSLSTNTIGFEHFLRQDRIFFWKRQLENRWTSEKKVRSVSLLHARNLNTVGIVLCRSHKLALFLNPLVLTSSETQTSLYSNKFAMETPHATALTSFYYAINDVVREFRRSRPHSWSCTLWGLWTLGVTYRWPTSTASYNHQGRWRTIVWVQGTVRAVRLF